jgi:hypothetical protein
MDLFLTSVVISFVLIFSLFCLLVTALTCYDLTWRDFLTLWPYKHWLGTFKEMFSVSFMSVGTLLFALVMYLPIKDSKEKYEMTKAGRCTCSCKACQAVVAHLGLTVEDIARLTSSTNSVANSTSK